MQRCSKAAHGQHGFTLLEVLVAMALLGAGLAAAFTAVSTNTWLERRIIEHTAAVDLARSKLDEALALSDLKLAQDTGEERYAGVDFGYRITLTALPVATEAQRQVLRGELPTLERVEVEVFWGNGQPKQSYRLRSYRTVKSPTTAAPPPRQP